MIHFCQTCSGPATRACLYPSCQLPPFFCQDMCRNNQNASLISHTHDGVTNLVPYAQVMERILEFADKLNPQYFDQVSKRMKCIKDELDFKLKQLELMIGHIHELPHGYPEGIFELISSQKNSQRITGKDLNIILNEEVSSTIRFTNTLDNLLSEIQSTKLYKPITINSLRALQYCEKAKQLEIRNSKINAFNSFQIAHYFDPQNADILFNFAYYYQAVKVDDDSLKYYFKYLRVAPKDHFQMGDCYNNIGMYYLYQSQFQKSIQYFNKSIQIDENDSIVFYNRGSAFFSLKNYEQALKDFNIAMKLNPDETYERNIIQTEQKLNENMQNHQSMDIEQESEPSSETSKEEQQ